MRLPFFVAFFALLILTAGCDSGREFRVPPHDPVAARPASGLPLPSTVAEQEFERQLYAFLQERRYLDLGWRRDKTIRDTGPYQNKVYFGTHPAVRIYYSPEALTWLQNGRIGELPDGAMLIKEMYPPPAVRYAGVADQTVPTQWTVMVRDKQGAHDGWFWSYFSSNPDGTTPPTPQPVDDPDKFPFNYPDSGFGLYCVRCHGSAAGELTFISTNNIEGFPGTPEQYPVDNSWMVDSTPEPVAHPNDVNDVDLPAALAQALAEGRINEEFLAYFDRFPAQTRDQVEALPPVSNDHVVAKAHRDFMTSDQCMSCHSGDNTNFGPNMVADQTDISPWGEWSWSMMGLAGRDPIFYAQLESEVALHGGIPGGDFTAETIQNTCLRCHGVMGQRQYTADHPDQSFTVEKAMASGEGDPHAVYGGLARDGVSCTVCHQIADQTGIPIPQIETGKFLLQPKADGLMQLFGPFANPTTRPMVESLGTLPVAGQHVQDSLLCASCHTVNLPVLNEAGKTVETRYEQSTYFEWQNSAFGQPGASFQSCQECHMPDTFHGNPLEFKLANVQDQDFPPADGTAPEQEITVQPRAGYRRHELAGINVFALEMFRQFPDILGVRTKSFMTGYENGLANSIENSLSQAAQSATVEILSAQQQAGQMEAAIRVTNLTGHRLPSGVGFRRMLLEVLIKDASGAVVWGSGRTNKLGIVVDGNGRPLPSESHQVDPVTGEQAFQPHYQVVTSESQAQIYEELIKDTQGQFTTSFLGRAQDVKDSRLMPLGWTFEGPGDMPPDAVDATNPHGGAASDPDFVDGTGSDTVRYQAQLPASANGPFTVEARLYYQAIPPYYLQDRFEQAAGPATRRLHYLASRLDVSQTSFPEWKLPLASASRNVP